MKFKIGDKVRVVKPKDLLYTGIGCRWDDEMDKWNGKVYEILYPPIDRNTPKERYQLEDEHDSWFFKDEWLELVNEDIEEIITKQYKTKDGKVFETKEEAEGWLLRSELQVVIEAWQHSSISEVMDTILAKYEIKRKEK